MSVEVDSERYVQVQGAVAEPAAARASSEVLSLRALEEREPDLCLPGRNRTKADLLFYRLGDQRVALKTYAGRPFVIRHGIGRWLTRREAAAYRAAGEVPGLPTFLGRLSPYALATEWVDAEPLSKLRGMHLGDGPFDAAAATLAALHERGVAVADLHHRDLLVTAGGRAYIVDLAASWVLGDRPGTLRRAAFRRLRELDLLALARLRARWTGREMPADATGAAARWHARGRRLKARLDRLRGKERRRH